MSTIDEIIGRISRYAVAVCKAKTSREMSMLDDARDSLRELIAAALADARLEGAEQMRASVESALDDLPLPDGF